jgi:polar amino acid transport system substrate-binding protein
VAAAMFLAAIGIAAAQSAMAQSRPAGVPEKGKSAIIDSIVERGTLRVGVTPTFPWLNRNKTDKGDPWYGSSWTLAKADAAALGVKLEAVAVSNDTKIPLLLSGRIDITISAISPNPDREKVIDFVPYSTSAFCMFGIKSDAKVAKVTNVDDLNKSDITFAAYVGTNQYNYIAKKFPNAKLRGVTGSGQAPLDEILSGRADLVLADAPQEPIFKSAHDNLFSIPADCTKSDLNETIVTHAIKKGDQIFLNFLLGIEKPLDAKLKQEDADNFKKAREHPDQM